MAAGRTAKFVACSGSQYLHHRQRREERRHELEKIPNLYETSG